MFRMGKEVRRTMMSSVCAKSEVSVGLSGCAVQRHGKRLALKSMRDMFDLT